MEMYLLTVLEAEVQDQGAGTVRSWLADGRLLTVCHMAFPQCTCMEGEISLYLFIRPQSYWIRALPL